MAQKSLEPVRSEKSETIVKASEISCMRGYSMVFKNMNVSLKPGQATILIGANGTGKTSLLRIIAGLLTPSSGTLEVSPDILWIAQNTPLKEALSANENLTFLSSLYTNHHNTPQAVLKNNGLEDLQDIPVRYLSMGQKRRVYLCLLSLIKADLWLLDEPSNHLDHSAIERLQKTVGKHLETGGAAIIASHRPDIWAEYQTLNLEKGNTNI